MKHLWIVLCILSIAVLLCGCSHDNSAEIPSSPHPVPSNQSVVSSKPLTQEQLDNIKVAYYDAVTANTRDLGDLQNETTEIIPLEDGESYQSYVNNTLDIRYIYAGPEDADFINEFGWYPIGTHSEYSRANLDKIPQTPQ